MREGLDCTLNMPPFPALSWNRSRWKGQVLLKSWKGFQSREGPYGTVSSKKGSKGSVRVDVDSLHEEGSFPTEEQAAAFQYLLDNEKAIRDVLLKAILKAYPTIRDSFTICADTEEEEQAWKDKVMPVIDRTDQLKSLIGLSTVHIHTVSKGKSAYIGFEFGCTWDDEHGLGAMMHQKRVVELGGADTSILEWIAQGDADKDKKKKAKKKR